MVHRHRVRSVVGAAPRRTPHGAQQPDAAQLRQADDRHGVQLQQGHRRRPPEVPEVEGRDVGDVRLLHPQSDHPEDARRGRTRRVHRALGDRGEHPSEHITAVGKGFAESKKPINGRVRTKGLSLRATDGDFTWGEGPEVAGSGVDLLLAISGRAGGLDQCEGPGVDTLRSRC
jgi:hypothetical protein